MHDPNSVLAAEDQFFSALIAADAALLGPILADDFLLVDPLGTLYSKAGLIELIASGRLRFTVIQRVESQVLFRGDVAVIVGRTDMKAETSAGEFSSRSRYTHVFANADADWQLVSAQGTPIAPA
jgi:ketosteroid isomerase-like protein